MALCKVWNENFLPFKQKMEDELISIEANRFVMMDQEKAEQFLAMFHPIELDAGNVQKPSSYKKLRIEQLSAGEEVKINKLKCMACSYIGKDKEDLDTHCTEKHLYQFAEPREREKRGAVA